MEPSESAETPKVKSRFSLRNFASKDKDDYASTSETFTEGQSFSRGQSVGQSVGRGQSVIERRSSTEESSDPDAQAIASHMLGDQPAGTAEEKLGFDRYVAAIAQFLTDPFTKTPLTLSIEGHWGAGKSSFMLQLEDALKTRGRYKVVRFNAWQYNADDGLWAAFIRDLTNS